MGSDRTYDGLMNQNMPPVEGIVFGFNSDKLNVTITILPHVLTPRLLCAGHSHWSRDSLVDESPTIIPQPLTWGQKGRDISRVKRITTLAGDRYTYARK